MFDFLYGVYICSYSCIRGSLSISIGHSQLLLETTSGEFARRFITFGGLSGICYGGEQLETRSRHKKNSNRTPTTETVDHEYNGDAQDSARRSASGA